jgi:TetR/AcrR family transcriptional regulator, mexJK operon transcriptional repressor
METAMNPNEEKRSDRKHREIMSAATAVFVEKGYDGASMEEIATKASVSKQTVYKHFADKERLFTAIILATTDQIGQVIGLVAETLAHTNNLEKNLSHLGRNFLSMLMDAQLLKLRRLVISNADRMPKLGRSWYEQGFERVLATLASCFQRLAQENLLQFDDPLIAANHFVGMLLWIPVNEAMFTGSDRPRSKAELDRYAVAAVKAFLAAYGVKTQAVENKRASAEAPSKGKI